MTNIASMLGRVMMGVKLPTRENDTALRTWAETEYRKDSSYAYERLKSGSLPDLR